MKLSTTELLLTTLLSIHLGAYASEEVCRIYVDKFDRASMFSRNFMAGESNRWPDKTVPYKIESGFSSSDIENIKKAMSLIEGSTCVKFVAYTAQANYLKIFTAGKGCFANLGYNSYRPESSLHLQTNSYCMRVGTIAHELLHVLGFAHEHTRPDRDEYLGIDWSVIPSDSVSNWFRCGGEQESPLPPVCNPKEGTPSYDNCYAGFQTTTFGLEYDYGSVMHYGLRAGSPKGEQVMTTKKTVPAGVTIGQRDGPSTTDFNKVNKAYPCDKIVTTVTPETTEKPCKDRYTNCRDLTEWCSTSKDIKDGCQLSCGICGGVTPTIPCKDKFTNCALYQSYCQTWAIISTGCQVTCGTCLGTP